MNLYAILNAPADTTGYYIAGYVIFFVVMALYLLSLFLRDRNLKREYEVLVGLEKEE
jgi:hypothetical protein